MEVLLRKARITKRFKNKNNFGVQDIRSFLLNIRLKQLYHHLKSDTYEFNYKGKAYVLKVSKHRPNLYGNFEVEINDYVVKKMNRHVIPDLYVSYKEMLLLSNGLVLFIFEKMQHEIWSVMDSSDIRKIKSIFLQILIGLWFLNHKAQLFHGDVCGRPEKPHLRNVMYNGTELKKRTFHLESESSRIPMTVFLQGVDLKFIDFGTSLFVNQKIKKKNKRYNVFFHNFLYHGFYSSLQIKSELMYATVCLLRYYKIENRPKLYNFFKHLKQKCSNTEQWDLKLIQYMNDSFESFMKSFSENFPFSKQTMYDD